MKIRLTSMIWLILGGAALFACQGTAATDSAVENYWLKGDTLLIRLRDGSGWRLDLYPEGRGSIRYGRHPNNKLTFDRVSFNFDSIRWRLTGNFNEKAHTFPPARIAFLMSNTEPEQSEVLRNYVLGRELFEVAFEAGLNGKGDLRAKRRMLKLFKTNPPFSE